MKTLLSRLDRLHLAALVLWTLPVVALLPLGTLWLWQSNLLFYWLLAMVTCSAIGYGLQWWLLWRNEKLLGDATTRASPNWPPKAEDAWTKVEQLAESVQPEDWPLHDGDKWWALGRDTLDKVARHYHPDKERPLLQLTIPHTLLIIERASRDLRATVTHNIPLSHQLTIGDMLDAWRWKTLAERFWNVYRAARILINPANALLSEASGQLSSQMYGEAWIETQRWLLREYVRKVGYYAIDLYSRQLTLVEADLTDEPLRILVAGRTNAGKSSLINALFGLSTAETDILPDTTTGLMPYRLEREGLTAALIFDTPGCDTELLSEKALRKAALGADLILWVCAAHRPDRQIERLRLDMIRNSFAEQPDRRPPPFLVAVSHIDQLRPHREWQPPYDLLDPQGTKAVNIRAAVEAVATDLAAPVDDVIPVCLAQGRVYNVNDALWAAMLDRQDQAGKVRFLRCLEQKRRMENWTLLIRQLKNAGRLLLKRPG